MRTIDSSARPARQRQPDPLRLLALVLACSLLVSNTPAARPAYAEPALPRPGPCVEGTLPHGALSLICIPASGWNGDLALWAHGYIAFNEPIDFYHLDFEGVYIPDLAQQLGFAFAATSYRRNGLAILEGADDIRELAAAFQNKTGEKPAHTYLLGASEGGIITTLVVEQSPDMVDGGLAMCGPIGSFRRQVNYDGDFRVLFDYFFPSILPPSPVNIPPALIDGWENTYAPQVVSAVQNNPDLARQLIRTTRAPVELREEFPQAAARTSTDLLWYSVFATNDAAAQLGGNPYGNQQRRYRGSRNDRHLNAQVQRFEAEPAALAALKPYETSGGLKIPLVTLHTSGDDVIPFWHEILYTDKARLSGGGRLTQIPVARYGHCNFKLSEVLGAFAVLVRQVSGHIPAGLQPIMTPEEAKRAFEQVRREQAASAPTD